MHNIHPSNNEIGLSKFVSAVPLSLTIASQFYTLLLGYLIGEYAAIYSQIEADQHLTFRREFFLVGLKKWCSITVTAL